MSQFRTGQERNPNVVGSGYIEHPPQRPFQQKVLVQPTTIKPEEIPEWYDAHGVLQHGPRPPAGRGQPSYNTGRGYQPPPPRPSGGVPGYHASPQPRPAQPRPHQPRPQAAYPSQPRPQYRPIPTAGAPRPAPVPGPAAGAGAYRPPHPGYAPGHVAPPRPTTPGVFDTSTLLNTLQVSTAPAAIAPARPQAPPARPAPPAAAAAAPAAAPSVDEGEKKLSKAAKAKLRKKMREGKA